MTESPITNNGQEVLRQALEAAEQRVRDLQAQLDEAQRIQQAWKDVATYMEKGWPLHLLTVLRDPMMARLIPTAPQPEAVAAACTEAQTTASAQVQGLNRRFPMLLEQACDQAGIPIDPESRHPNYSLDQQFFQLSFNADKQTVRLSNVEGRLNDIPADIGAVTDAIQRERRRLFERPFNGAEFARKLYANYQAVLKKEQRADSAVPIRAITRRLGKNEKGFRTDEFIVDLSRLVTDGPLDVDGYRLDLQQTKDTSQGIILRGPAARGYVGFIVFRKAGA
jgi:hypothetical protein